MDILGGVAYAEEDEDGEAGRDTIAALRKALDAQTAPANPMEKRYTITIHGVNQEEADAMKKRWPDAEVTRE